MSTFTSVLLLDDNEDDNFIHERYIRRVEWAEEIIVFEEAELALDYLKNTTEMPQIIFIDVNMPVMNGFQFLDKASEAGVPLSRAQVVMVTSSLHPDDCQRAAEHPLVNEYLNKPIDADALNALAARLLNQV